MPVVIKENIVLKREDYVPMQPWISPDGIKGYIPTPKVASSTVTRVLSHENSWIRKDKPENCFLFALIRHPYDRWISGTTEHWNPILTKGGNDLTPLINTSFKDLLKESIKDRHTQPQAWNFDIYHDVTLIKLEHLFILWDWLWIENPRIHERNHLTMGGLQKDIWKIVAKKAKRKKIENFYSEDMQLWNNAI